MAISQSTHAQAGNQRTGKGTGRRADGMLMPSRRTHGQAKSPTYVSWMKMKSRCLNPNANNYDRYGGAGVTVCSEWMLFANFLRDMGERPSLSHSIDRIDGAKVYSKATCKWSTDTEQSQNRACCRHLTANGETRTPLEWAEKQGIPVNTIYNRIYMGWSDADAIFAGNTHHRMLTVSGETKNLKTWAEIYGVTGATIHKRLKRGWSVESAVTGVR
jgi:hypothetical protein